MTYDGELVVPFTEMDMDSLAQTIESAVKRIVEIREVFEDHNVDFEEVRRRSSKYSTELMPARRTSRALTTTSVATTILTSDEMLSFRSTRSSPIISKNAATADGDPSVSSPSTSTATSTGTSVGDEHEHLEGVDPDAELRSMSQYKEARLNRMKDIKVTFHNGLPQEFYKAIGRFLKATVEVKRRFAKLKVFKDVFLGSEAVATLISHGFASDEADAILYGNVLIKLAYIEHVAQQDTLQNNSSSFYRFTKALDYVEEEFEPKARLSVTASNFRESMQIRDSTPLEQYRFSEASDEIHAMISDESLAILSRVLHRVFDKKNKLLFYKNHVGCFLGAEAVAVLRELRIATNLIDAIMIGQCLLDEGVIVSIGNTHTFQNKYLFYRLANIS